MSDKTIDFALAGVTQVENQEEIVAAKSPRRILTIVVSPAPDDFDNMVDPRRRAMVISEPGRVCTQR